ncbi:MAG: LacI family DNA-binding transcriptional regulator [Balneolales bacterium]
MKKKTTLNDIAKILNLTKVSVSKALRNHPDISESTKEKVKEVAKSVGYRPNLIARSLTSSKSRTLGVVVPKIAHNFFAHAIAGIQKHAAGEGYGIVLTVSEESAELEKKHIESLVSMQVEGLLVSISMETKNPKVYEWIKELQIPLVFFDRHIADLGFNSVTINDEKSAMNGVEQLIKLGNNNIAHLAGYNHNSIGYQRKKGYEMALKKYNLKVDKQKIIDGGFGEEAGYKGFKQLLSRNSTFDALFAVTFPVALGAYIAMKEHDPSYLNKIQMLTIGDSGLRSIVPYPQYYIDQPSIAIGEKAAELLIKEINGEVKPNNHVEYMETKFVVAGNENSLEVS